MTARDLLDEGLGLEEEEEEDPAPDPDAAKKANRQLQAHLKKVEAENKAFRAQLIGVQLKEIGLDPEKGLGKAIAKDYEGEMTLEAVTQYALDEYGHEAAETPAAPPEVAQGQNIETIQQGSQPVTPPPATTPAQDAERRMHDPTATRQDAVSSLNAKVLQFAEEHYPQGTQTGSSQ